MAAAKWLITSGFSLTIASCLTTIVLSPRYASDDFSRAQKALAWNLAWLPFVMVLMGWGLGLWGSIRQSHEPDGPTRKGWIAGTVFLGAAASLAQFIGLSSCGPGQNSRWECAGNLRQVGVALHDYHDNHGAFPPATAVGNDGQPWHSWRFLISKKTENREWFEAYRQDEPWNGPHNLAISGQGGPAFRCPRGPNWQSAIAHVDYVVVQDSGFVFDGGRACKLRDIKDPLWHTILVVEASDTGISWTEPRDLSWNDFLNRYQRRKLGHHRPGFNVLMADGSVQFLEYGQLDEATLRSLFTKDGGEPGPF